MPAWLIEGDPVVYLILACVALACFALWWRTRKRRYAIAGVVAVLLGVVFFLLDRSFESDREQIERKTQEVAAAVQRHDVAGAFRHISEEFHYGATDKKGLRAFAEQGVAQRNVTEMTVWGFEPGAVDRAARTAGMNFLFKVRGNWSAGGEFFRCESIWKLDPDGQWRLFTFKIFNPAVAPPGPPHGLLGLFAHDATVRRTALGSAAGLVATAFAFFRPPRWPRDLGRPPGPPTDMAGA